MHPRVLGNLWSRGGAGSRRGGPPRRLRLLSAGVVVAILAVLMLGTGIASAQNVLVGVVEDTDIGAELYQVTYTSDWTACGGCQPSSPNGSFHYSNGNGNGTATAVIRFRGTDVVAYGGVGPLGGRAMFVIDDFPPQVVDTSAPTAGIRDLFHAEFLADTDHILYIFNLGPSSSDSPADLVIFDRAEVFQDAESLSPHDGPRSHQPWLSGVNGDPTMSSGTVDAFCDWRGSACDLAHVFVARDSWASITEPSFVETNFDSWQGQLLISVPPFPENQGASLQECANGAYDVHWRRFGETLNETGRQDSIVRIAWQANGSWYEWSATDPVAYVECWRRIADAINETASPDPFLDWSINGGYSHNPPSHNPLELYPGDEWVDLVGIDYFDHYPPSLSREEFDARANDVGGITWLYQFALGQGKRFGVGSWGVVSGGGGGGDNPGFVQYMRDWMISRSGVGMYYEAYFNICDAGTIGSNIARPVVDDCVTENQAAGTRYQELWRRPELG